MGRLKSNKAKAALTTLGVLIALCIPVAQASATVPTWHLGQVNLSELGKTVEFSSAGTATVEFTIAGEVPAKLDCEASGKGVLAGESSLTLKGCKAYLNGTRHEECDPQPIALNFSASMQSQLVTMKFPAGTCSVPAEIELHPGEMKLEAGKEAFDLDVNISEQTKAGKRPASITGSLSMWLESPFAGRSFGAGPAPLVHIGGKTLEELKKTEAPFASEDSLTIDLGGVLPTFKCSGAGSGTLRSRGLNHEELTLYCVVVGAEKTCYVEPLHIGLSGSFESTEKVFATIHTVDGSGSCSVDEEIEVPTPAGYLWYGAEATSLSVQEYATTSAWGGTTISGESHWYVEGGGSKLGIW